MKKMVSSRFIPICPYQNQCARLPLYSGQAVSRILRFGPVPKSSSRQHDAHLLFGVQAETRVNTGFPHASARMRRSAGSGCWRYNTATRSQPIAVHEQGRGTSRSLFEPSTTNIEAYRTERMRNSWAGPRVCNLMRSPVFFPTSSRPSGDSGVMTRISSPPTFISVPPLFGPRK
jgi:hypothetical protein